MYTIFSPYFYTGLGSKGSGLLKTDEYDEFFIPGTIMLSDKATFQLRMQESCE